MNFHKKSLSQKSSSSKTLNQQNSFKSKQNTINSSSSSSSTNHNGKHKRQQQHTTSKSTSSIDVLRSDRAAGEAEGDEKKMCAVSFVNSSTVRKQEDQNMQNQINDECFKLPPKILLSPTTTRDIYENRLKSTNNLEENCNSTTYNGKTTHNNLVQSSNSHQQQTAASNSIQNTYPTSSYFAEKNLPNFISTAAAAAAAEPCAVKTTTTATATSVTSSTAESNTLSAQRQQHLLLQAEKQTEEKIELTKASLRQGGEVAL